MGETKIIEIRDNDSGMAINHLTEHFASILETIDLREAPEEEAINESNNVTNATNFGQVADNDTTSQPTAMEQQQLENMKTLRFQCDGTLLR